MRRVRLKSPADLDYFQALEGYEKQRPGLGREFDAELQGLFQQIMQNPEFFSKETEIVRKARMPRFKYRAYFTIEADEIGVVAIYHPSRNPKTLRKRFGYSSKTTAPSDETPANSNLRDFFGTLAGSHAI